MNDDDSGIYDLSGAQPTVEQSHPEGGGVGSASEAGGNKRDPVSSSPTIGRTIAGREINTGAPGDHSNAGHGIRAASPEKETVRGGADTEAKGVTGTKGKSPSSAHPTVDTETSDADASR
jgi:hypothetical protein